MLLRMMSGYSDSFKNAKHFAWRFTFVLTTFGECLRDVWKTNTHLLDVLR